MDRVFIKLMFISYNSRIYLFFKSQNLSHVSQFVFYEMNDRTTDHVDCRNESVKNSTFSIVLMIEISEL